MIHECGDGEVFQIGCGCELIRCTKCETLRSKSKCVLHRPEKHDPAVYYLHELRGMINHLPRHTIIAAEVEAAAERLEVEIPWGSPQYNNALDICSGIGLYAPMLLRKGYQYEALETDHWASRYIEGAYGGPVHRCRFEEFPENATYDIIIMAHGLEHLADAPAMLGKVYRLLKDRGLLILLIPDNTDLGNPDHLWFFTETSIRQWAEELGFQDIRSETRRVVKWENFIYLFAQRS